MLLERSRLAVTEPIRPRLAPPLMVTGFSLLAATVLVLLFPRQELLRRVHEVEPGPLTDSYVSALLRTEPGNDTLRLRFVLRQIRLRNFTTALNLLAPLLKSSSAEVRQQALWLQWQIRHDAGQLGGDLRTLVQLPYDALSAETLADNTLTAMEAGASTFALSLLEQLEKLQPGKIENFTRFAQMALNAGEYRLSADLYFRAQAKSQSLTAQRVHFLAAMRALQSGNQLDLALKLAETHLGQLVNDRDTLIALIQLARAAGRGNIATTYARKLIRLNLRESLSQLQWPGLHVRRVANHEAEAPSDLNFDGRSFRLSYEVFVENGALEDAYQVARAAVRSYPSSATWQERLATVAGWTERPLIALDAWLAVARLSGRDAAWKRAYALASASFADDRLLPILEHYLARESANPRWRRELIAVHERLGDTDAAVRLLAEAARSDKAPHWQRERAALLTSRGDFPAAIAAWRDYLAQSPADVPARQQLIDLLVLTGDDAAALVVLKAAPAGTHSAAWLRLQAELAWRLGDPEGAKTSLRELVARGEANPADFDRLLALGDARHKPLELARQSEAAWQTHRRYPDLLRALTIYLEAAQHAEFLRVLTALSTDELGTLAGNPQFLQELALHLRTLQNDVAAMRFLGGALALAPQNSSLREAVLWAALEIKSETGANLLRRLLAQHEATWQRDARLHNVLAAAWLNLGAAPRALQRYLTPQVGKRQGDFLWLMNYADALEQAADFERAWQLRRHLWTTHAGKAIAARSATDEAGQLRRMAQTRLALVSAGGDRQAAILRELLQLGERAGSTRTEPDASEATDTQVERTLANKAYSRLTRDIATAWLIDGGEYSAARGWMWARYIERASRPDWADMGLALATGDDGLAGEILDAQGRALNAALRAPAAERLLSASETADAAYEAASPSPDDPARHALLQRSLLAASAFADIELARQTLGALREDQLQAGLRLRVGPRLALEIGLQSSTRTSIDPGALGSRLPDEDSQSLALIWNDGRAPGPGDFQANVGLARRDALQATTPLWAELQWSAFSDLTLQARLERDAANNDSTVLRLAGASDSLELRAGLRLSSRDYLGLSLRDHRYQLQSGQALGNGRNSTLDYTHTLRFGQPDVTLGGFVAWHDGETRADSFGDAPLLALLPDDSTDSRITASVFVPASFRFSGLRVAVGLADASTSPSAHRRGPRPFLSLARTWHSQQGAGHEFELGLAGSLLGADHLALSYAESKNGSAGNNSSAVYRLRYRHHF